MDVAAEDVGGRACFLAVDAGRIQSVLERPRVALLENGRRSGTVRSRPGLFRSYGNELNINL